MHNSQQYGDVKATNLMFLTAKSVVQLPARTRAHTHTRTHILYTESFSTSPNTHCCEYMWPDLARGTLMTEFQLCDSLNEPSFDDFSGA